MKKQLLSIALATSLATVSVQASPSIAQDDINQVFTSGSLKENSFSNKNNQLHQVEGLSSLEMQETTGKYFGVDSGFFGLTNLNGWWYKSWW